VETIRCGKCNKKLAEAEFSRLSIKCPRCGAMNHLKAIEPPNPAQKALKETDDDHAL
jgi:phage FluMu protein Com